MTMHCEKKSFGRVNGVPVDLFTLINANGVTMTVTNYGGTVTSLTVPDRNGNMADVVLGFNDISGYLKTKAHHGAIIGRTGNRIGNARFTLEGKEYKLAANNGKNNLHGGFKGFDRVVWEAAEVRKSDAIGLELKYLSKDGEEGFPGNLSVTVVYWLTNANEWIIEYTATTDKTTVVNLTQHAYFNLVGEGSGDVLDHEVMLNASRFVAGDEGLIPTREILEVRGTPLDFTTPFAIGARVNADHPQLKAGRGYDHNWVINQKRSGEPTLAATVFEPKSGRYLEVTTTEPGVQFYIGNFLDGSDIGKSGKPYVFRSGFCLETQHFPDSPNNPAFPSVVLKPGQIYRTITIYRFLAK